MTEILKTELLCKQYIQGSVKIDAIKNVSIYIKDGEFIVIIGKSGCGKSTLLHLLGGVDQPTKGTVMIDGRCITEMAETELTIFRRQKLGFMFQFFNLIPELNVYENILYPVWLDKKKEDKAYIKKLIDILDLGDRINHIPDQLSGGQQQRVALARALANKPKIILCDEPTGNLDYESAQTVLTMLRNIQKELNQTLIIVTHDRDIAVSASRCLVITNGEIAN